MKAPTLLQKQVHRRVTNRCWRVADGVWRNSEAALSKTSLKTALGPSWFAPAQYLVDLQIMARADDGEGLGLAGYRVVPTAHKEFVMHSLSENATHGISHTVMEDPKEPASGSLFAHENAHPAAPAAHPATCNLDNYRGTGEIVPFVDRAFEWGVAIATFLSVLSIVPRHCARLTYFFHPKLRKINAVLITPTGIQPYPAARRKHSPLLHFRCCVFYHAIAKARCCEVAINTAAMLIGFILSSEETDCGCSTSCTCSTSLSSFVGDELNEDPVL